VYRISSFDRFDLFAPDRHRQREAVKWLQRKIIEANAEADEPRPVGFLARLFGSDRGPVSSYLRIADPLGVGASDLVYPFAWTTNLFQLQRCNERLGRSAKFRARYNRCLKGVSPLQIEEMRTILVREQAGHSGRDYGVVFRWAHLVSARWDEVHARVIARGNLTDRWFSANYQAAVWDHNTNACMKCGSKPAAFRDRTLAHAFVPLSQGGTFVMRTAEGALELNAIPLCRRCNSAKRDTRLEQFFTHDELTRIGPFLRSFEVDLTPPARSL
jgi:hypothetical protein